MIIDVITIQYIFPNRIVMEGNGAVQLFEYIYRNYSFMQFSGGGGGGVAAPAEHGSRFTGD